MIAVLFANSPLIAKPSVIVSVLNDGHDIGGQHHRKARQDRQAKDNHHNCRNLFEPEYHPIEY